MPKPPASAHRTDDRAAAAKARVEALGDDQPPARSHLPNPEDATDVLGEVDTSRPVEERAGTDSDAPTVEQPSVGSSVPVLASQLDRVTAEAFAVDMRALAGLVEVKEAETVRHARKTHDLDTVFTLTGLLAEAKRHLDTVDHVPDELRRRVVKQATAWAQNGDGAP